MSINSGSVDKYNSVGDNTAMIALVLDGWDAQTRDNAGQPIVKELIEYRLEATDAECEELAGRIFRRMVDLGEHLPDMYWVHVAVICSDLLKWGLVP